MYEYINECINNSEEIAHFKSVLNKQLDEYFQLELYWIFAPVFRYFLKRVYGIISMDNPSSSIALTNTISYNKESQKYEEKKIGEHSINLFPNINRHLNSNNPEINHPLHTLLKKRFTLFVNNKSEHFDLFAEILFSDINLLNTIELYTFFSSIKTRDLLFRKISKDKRYIELRDSQADVR